MDLADLTDSDLERLVAEFPLPDGVEDVVLNREELADHLATTVNTVSQWIGAGMPVQQEGGNGKAYELRLAHCYAWRQAKKRDQDLRSEKVRRNAAAMRLALVGGASGESLDALDPKQKREILAAQIEQERFMRHRNELLPRDDVRDLLEHLFAMVRDTMEAAPDRVERVEAIPPKAVQAMIDVCDGVVDEVRMRIENFWDLRRPDKRSERKDLFDA
ncbi:hypothetical protein [Oceaniradius stylonematis]|uniref:hypothetical protein n=1 Tax=Oceaniradius stylonematis TaxID=2184161 RepID=UPI003B5CEEB1